MGREEELEFLEAMITEMLKLSLRANLRTLVYLLGMAKVATAEARRGNSPGGNGPAGGNSPLTPAQQS